MPKPLKPREVWGRLKAHDKRFELFTKRGKGSHVMINHPDVDGKRASAPCPNHKGKDVSIGVLKSLIRRFNLPQKFSTKADIIMR